MDTLSSWLKSMIDWWTTSRYLKGGRLNSVVMSNIDIKQVMSNITNEPFDVVKYIDLTKYLTKKLPTFLIILFNYPEQIGHWCLLYTGFNTIYFFDPYGLPPDAQWPYLENPLNMPEPMHILTDIINEHIKHGYQFSFNPLNIQGHLRNGDIRDSECGELVIFRAMYIGLNDYEFMRLCMNIGGHQLFDLISKLDRPKSKIIRV